MNKKELHEKLQSLGVPSDCYCLEERGAKNDRLVLEKKHNDWEVYYFSERGTKHEEVIFTSEEEACEYTYNRLINMMKYI